MIVCLLAAPSVDLAACVVLVECVFVYTISLTPFTSHSLTEIFCRTSSRLLT